MAKDLTKKNALICGDSRSIIVTFPFDITGYEIFFTVKDENGLNTTDDSGAIIAKTISNGITIMGSTATVALSPTDTRVVPSTYTWDIQAVSPSGTVSSTLRRDIEFVADVTKDI
jgi:hypothetical protein